MSQKFLETIRLLHGEALHLEYHQRRMDRTLNVAGIYQLSEFIEAPARGLYKCRIVYSMDEIAVEYLPYQKRSVRKLKLVYDDTIQYDKKYLDRSEIDRLYAQRGDADEILIVQNGLLKDTSIANIALYDGEKWFTPKTPLLAGSCRERVLDEGRIFAKDIRVEDLFYFKKMALMNAMIDFDIIASEKLEDIMC